MREACGTLATMAQPFETELEQLAAKFARELTHEVTALILRRLGIEKTGTRSLGGGGGGAPRSSAAKPARGSASSMPKRGVSAKPGKAQAAKPSRRTRATLEERAASLNEVERIVAASEGLSAGEIERKSGLSRAAVAGALKALKDEGRLFMGGTKRFARYAMTQAAADKASRDARGGAGSE
jgi:biotin operon repressor